MSPLLPLTVAAVSVVTGLVFIVFGSTVVEGHNTWPLLCLIFYVVAPIPFFLCGGARHSGGSTWFPLVGLFLGALLASSGPGLALLLYHIGSIRLTALLLTLASGLCFLISARSICFAMSNDEEVVEEDDLFG